jgi:shikimate 5-dehydrogenase
MRYLIFNTLADAKTKNSEIHQWMIDNVEGYKATKWSNIIKNNDGTKFAIPIKETDTRKPINALSIQTRNTLSELDNTWYSENNDGISTLNYLKE